MATLVKRTVKYSGGNHSNLAAAVQWFYNNYPNFVSSDIMGEIEISGNWGANSDRVAISGGYLYFTHDSTHYLKIYTVGASRHLGREYVNGDEFYKFIAGNSTAYSDFMNFSGGNSSIIHLDGLYFDMRNTTSGSWRFVSMSGTASNKITVSNCLVFAPTATSGFSYVNVITAGTFTCVNCSFKGLSANQGRALWANSGSVVYLYNSLSDGNNYGFIMDSGVTGAAYNNVAFAAGSGNHFSFPASGFAHDYNAAPISYSEPNGVNIGSDHPLIFFGYASGDYRLKYYLGATKLIGEGTTDPEGSGTFLTDQRGTTRSAPWAIGPFEYKAPTLVKKTIKPSGQGGDYTNINEVLGWLALNQQSNLFLNDIYVEAEISGDWTGVTDITIMSWSLNIQSDITHYLSIYTVGQARHSGSWGTINSPFYKSIFPAGWGTGSWFDVQGNIWLYVDGLYFDFSEITNITYARLLYEQNSDPHVFFTNCMIKGNPVAGTGSYYFFQERGYLTIANCIFKGYKTANMECIYSATYAGRYLYLYNNTFEGFKKGVTTNSGTVGFAYNNIIFNATAAADCVTWAAGMTHDYNALGETNAEANGVYLGTSNNWANIFWDWQNGDYRLRSWSGSGKVQDEGLDDPAGGGLYSVDIKGKPRVSPWDIGANEWEALWITVSNGVVYLSGGTPHGRQYDAPISIGDLSLSGQTIYALGYYSDLKLYLSGATGTKFIPITEYIFKRASIDSCRRIISRLTMPFVHQTSLRIDLDTRLNLFDGVSFYIKFRRPDGSEGSWSAVRASNVNGSACLVRHDFSATSELNMSGDWMIWPYVTFADGRSAPGEAFQMPVLDEGYFRS